MWNQDNPEEADYLDLNDRLVDLLRGADTEGDDVLASLLDSVPDADEPFWEDQELTLRDFESGAITTRH